MAFAFSHPLRLGVGWIVFLLMVLAGNAWGNGVYIPERAYPKLPEIPAQQAIILYRNGTETLIVESAFQTDAPAVAWILPLPAAPSSLELADPGILTSAMFSLRPEVRHDLSGMISTALLVGIAACPFLWVLARTADRAQRHSRYVMALLLVLMFSCLVAIMLPSLGTARSIAAPSADITVLSAKRLGDAEFSVISARNAEAVDQWLTDHDLRGLEAEAKGVVEQYIHDGWCFVIGKLETDKSGDLRIPRPLMATFASREPVFPMKLTGLARSTTQVELCVIAQQAATAAGFRCIASDQMRHVPAEPAWRSADSDAARGALMCGDNTRIRMGHPDLVSRMWTGCIVTHLSGQLVSGEMHRDVILGWTAPSPYRSVVYSADARRTIAIATFIYGALAWLAMLAWCARGQRRVTPGAKRFLSGALLGVLGLSVCVLCTLPTTPVHTVKRLRVWINRERFARAIVYAVQEGSLDRSAVESPRLREILLQKGWDESHLMNPYTGAPLRRERSPGNYDLRVDGQRLLLDSYDDDGVPHATCLLPSKSR